MVRTEHQPDSSRDYPSRPMLPDAVPVLLPPPPMDDEYVPCSDCHEDEPTEPHTERELEDEHDEMEFAHGRALVHGLSRPERPREAPSRRRHPVEFEDSWQLCTQCHGKKLADWRAGVHGKRTGHWRGPKEYRTCVACHNPHRPPFQPLEPKPPPLRPTDHADRSRRRRGRP